VPLAFLGRHAAGSAAIAVELALALCKKGYDIPDEAILEGLAAVENRSSIRVLSQRPLVVLDACRTPQQAIALLRVLNMAKVRHLSAVIGLAEEEGAEAFFSALESGLTAETQKKDRTTMPGMSENPFDKVFLVPPAGTDAAMTERNWAKANLLYDLLEHSELFHGTAQEGSRSIANVTFRTGDADLDAAFVAGAAEHQIQNVKGHRLVGGMRASVYNAVTMEDVQALASYMKDFEAQHSLSPRSN